jgi:hypothetical protein
MSKDLTKAKRYDCIVNPSRTTAWEVMTEAPRGDWVRSSDYERDVHAAFEAGMKQATQKVELQAVAGTPD